MSALKKLEFDIPNEEYERVASAFCAMQGHTPCGDPNCLLLMVTKMVIARVTNHEKVVATKNAVANLMPLNILPQVT